MAKENLFTFSDTPPTSSQSGKCWGNTASGQVFMYLNGSWTPWAGGNPGGEGYTFKSPMIIINGDDVSHLVRKKTPKFNNAITDEIDYGSFLLQDVSGVYKPLAGSNITAFKGKIEDDEMPEKIFGGIVTRAPQTKMGTSLFKYNVNCLDYSKRLNNKLALKSYTSQTGGYIVKDLIDTYMPEFTYENVDCDIVIDSIKFNYMPVGLCIERLAKLIGYEWYVDYDKDIHLFSQETNTAPYDLDETGATGRYKNLIITIDVSQVRNRVLVRGGSYLSNNYPDTQVSDGEQEQFNLAYNPNAPVTMTVDGAPVTLGVDNLHLTGYDFVLNYTEKFVRNLDHAKLASGKKVIVNYKPKIPILIRRKNKESIAELKTIEGGDGIHEIPIVDSSIKTLDEARKRALAELRKFAFPHISGSFFTDQSGYRSGQQLTIDLPSRQIDTTVMIQEVITRSIGAGNFMYEVRFSTDEE